MPAFRMRRGLRILAAVLALATLAVWLATGAHTGWTRTSRVVMKIDPVTELEYPESEPTFVAGVEVVGGGLGLALLLASANNAAPGVIAMILAYLLCSAAVVIPYVVWRRKVSGR